MKTLKRNQSRFFYALYSQGDEIVDEYGNPTGEHEFKYSEPIEAFANISAGTGEVVIQLFGANVKCDKVIVADNDCPPIDEYTVLWIDTLPDNDNFGAENTPYDYIVKKVAKSLNSVSIAISKVTVSE